MPYWHRLRARICIGPIASYHSDYLVVGNPVSRVNIPKWNSIQQYLFRNFHLPILAGYLLLIPIAKKKTMVPAPMCKSFDPEYFQRPRMRDVLGPLFACLCQILVASSIQEFALRWRSLPNDQQSWMVPGMYGITKTGKIVDTCSYCSYWLQSRIFDGS